VVRAERVSRPLDELIGDEDDVALAAMTVAELMVGHELGGMRERRRRRAFFDALVPLLTVEPYDFDVAAAHARLLVAVHRAGRPCGAYDLIIAATALARGRTVVTADARGFEDLPGIAVRSTPSG